MRWAVLGFAVGFGGMLLAAIVPMCVEAISRRSFYEHRKATKGNPSAGAGDDPHAGGSAVAYPGAGLSVLSTSARIRSSSAFMAAGGAVLHWPIEAPIPVIGGKTGPVVGWRIWGVGPEGRLRSMNIPYSWPAGPGRAQCLYSVATHREPPPVLACGCGFYAMSSPDDAIRLRPEFPMTVAGVVLGWGRVIVHETGWRSEWAQIAALLIPPWGTTPIHEALARSYRVPLMTQDQAEMWVKEWE